MGLFACCVPCRIGRVVLVIGVGVFSLLAGVPSPALSQEAALKESRQEAIATGPTAGWEVIELTEPWRGQPSQLRGPTEFVVKQAFEGFAVTLEGDFRSPLRANRFDGIVPPIRIECNYASQGLLLDRLDNAVVEMVVVRRALGTGLSVMNVRQSHLRSLWVTECDSSDLAAVTIGTLDRDQTDPSNGCTIDHLQVLACGNPRYLEVLGRTPKQIRNMQFGTVFLHTPWDNIPREGHPRPTVFDPREGRVLLYLEQCIRCSFDALNVRADHHFPGANTAIQMGDKVEYCNFRGSIIEEAHHRSLVGSAESHDFDVTLNRKRWNPESP